jgi:regulator of protease activity HflC (stomatin/prohibitin superfamily)
VRNSLNEVAFTYAVEDIYGEGKAEFLHKVEAMIQTRVSPVGVTVQQFGFIGAPRGPQVIATAITAKGQAIEQADGARNELPTTQAAKKIAEAEGDAKSMVTRAQGQADANRIRQNSLTPPGFAPHRKFPRADRQVEWPVANCRVRPGQRHDAAAA